MLKSETETIRDALNDMVKKIAALEKSGWDALIGRRVRIADHGFNGQLAGNSKPSLFGKEFVINWVSVDGNGVFVSFKDFAGTTSARLDQIEFI